MHTSERNPAQTRSCALRHEITNCGSAFRHRTLSAAAAFLWTIAFAVAVPTAAEAQSWLKKLEEEGKRLLDRTIDEVSRPSDRPPDQQTTPAGQPPSDSKPSYARAQVREVQRLLIDLGYKPGAVDGTYVPATATAIRAYQSDHGLAQTGVPSSELIAHLKNTQAAQLAAAAGQAPTGSVPKQQTSQPGGGMIAPAPEGAPTTAAQERTPETNIGKSTRSPGPAETTAGVSTVSSGGLEIDVLAPEGISIGMRLSEAKAALKARGYSNIPGERGRPFPCGFNKPGASGGYGTTVNLAAGANQKDCIEGEAVRSIHIRYDVFDAKDPSLLRLVQVAESRLGSAADCGRLNDSAVGCRWNSPPNAPLVEQVSVDGGVARPMKKFRTMLTLQLLGKKDLKAHGRAPALSSPGGSEPGRSADPRPAHTDPTESKVRRSTQSSGLAGAAAQSARAPQTGIIMPSTGGFDPVAAAGTAPGGALSDATIPTGLLLYKYAPDAFTDKYLLEKAREQIHQDQWAYKNPKHPPTDHVFVFSKQQVEGRAADFAAKDLLAVYKNYLAGLANQIPGRLNFTTRTALVLLEYSEGALRTKSQPYLSREYKLPEWERRDIPRQLQSWEILGHMPQISGPLGNLRLGSVTKSFDARGRRPLLVLDRDPEVPPIPMKSADAERMWKKPECSPVENSYVREGATSPSATQAANDCRVRLESYASQPAIKTVFEIEIERVTVTERTWIVEARLVGASVYSPYQELIKRFAANDFVSVDKKLAGVQQREAKIAEEQRSRIASLAQMDLLGVRLGMSVKEAESVLRANQKIQTVYRFSASPPPRQASASATEHFQPYTSGLLFLANEGKDVVVLFYGSANEVIGVTRKMLADGLTNEKLTAALNEKYGKPAHTDNHGWTWGQTSKGFACAGHGNIDPGSKMELVEGKAVDHVTYKAVGIGVRREAKADTLAGCNTVLQVGANLAGTAKPTVEFRLFNHSTVSGALKEVEGQTKSRATKAGKDLKL